jgi:hypothetical protein
MSIFTQTNLTPAQLAAQQILQIAKMQFQQLSRSGTQGYNLIWNNRSADPEDVIAALGTNAKAVFELAELNIDTINEASEIGGVTAPAIGSVPSEYSLTFNSDGSANVVYNGSSSSAVSLKSAKLK